MSCCRLNCWCRIRSSVERTGSQLIGELAKKKHRQVSSTDTRPIVFFEDLVGDNFDLTKQKLPDDFDLYYDQDRTIRFDVKEGDELDKSVQTKLNIIYDFNQEKNIILHPGNSRNRTSPDPYVNAYSPTGFQYNINRFPRLNRSVCTVSVSHGASVLDLLPLPTSGA